jgi:hypothetical protein
MWPGSSEGGSGVGVRTDLCARVNNDVSMHLPFQKRKKEKRIVDAVPEGLLAAAREEVILRGYSLASHRMMYHMGWAPGMAGIGKRGQGRPEPSDRSESVRPTPQG